MSSASTSRANLPRSRLLDRLRLYHYLAVQVLQPIDADLIEVIECLAGCQRRRQRRVVGHTPVHGFTTNGMRFDGGLLTFGGIDDEVDLIVLDHVDDVRPPLAHFVDA